MWLRWLVLVWMVAPSTAAACQCIPGGIEWVVPLDGQTDVPLNAEIRLWGHQTHPPEVEVFEDGAAVGLHADEERSFGPHTLRIVRPERPFAPQAPIEVRLAASGDPLFGFETGQEIDDEAPTWDGTHAVEDLSGDYGTCGALVGHRFEWSGVGDDGWDTEQLVAVAEPVEVGTDAAGLGEVLEVVSFQCVDDDPTLQDELHREYRVHFVDGSGNRSEAFLVATGDIRRCGCSVPQPSPTLVLWVLPAVLAAARRSRPSVRGTTR